MLTQFYRRQTEPQGDEGALGRLGNSHQSWKGMVKLSYFSSKQFPTMKPYSLLCQRKLLHDAEMCQAIQYIFLSTHFEYGACSYFEISLVSTGILGSTASMESRNALLWKYHSAKRGLLLLVELQSICAT